ncbi:MAG: hypothetical protein RL318_747, partial [Fibrobacterota bacterium]
MKLGGILPALILSFASASFAEDPILVLHPAGDKFQETVKGIREGLGGDFKVT